MPLHAYQSADVCTVCVYNNKRRITTCDQHIVPSFFPQHFRTMGAKQLICCLGPPPSPAPSPSPSPTPSPGPHAPNVQFRVLIIGRANAGKTSILQRVCDTTESPVIYRSRGSDSDTRSQVCARSQCRFQSHHHPSRLNSNPQQRSDPNILSPKADHDDPVDSVAFTTSRMNLPSRTTLDTFSTTLADSRQAVQTS